MSFTLPDPGQPNRRFERPADRAASSEPPPRSAAAASRREGGPAARPGAIPAGAEVHIALSETMRELGLAAETGQHGRDEAIRPRLNALDRVSQARQRRKLGAAPTTSSSAPAPAAS